jgi:hypothetical protein
VDQAEYELLSRVEAGEDVFIPAPMPGTPWPSFEYVVARLLQLRARGLVRFIAAPEGDHYLAGPCHLTQHGRAVLRLEQRSVAEDRTKHRDQSG